MPVSKANVSPADPAEHSPEYHDDRRSVGTKLDAAIARNYDETPSRRLNPFLHPSMHRSISEQCSIDQPRGIRQAVELPAIPPTLIRCTTPTTPACGMPGRGEQCWESQRHSLAVELLAKRPTARRPPSPWNAWVAGKPRGTLISRSARRHAGDQRMANE